MPAVPLPRGSHPSSRTTTCPQCVSARARELQACRAAGMDVSKTNRGCALQSCCSRTHHQAQRSSSPRLVMFVAGVSSVQAPRAMFRKRIADVTRAHQAVTKCCRDSAKCTAKRCGNADAEFACAMSILSCCVTCMACPLGSRPRWMPLPRCTMDVATPVCALTRMSRALP